MDNQQLETTLQNGLTKLKLILPDRSKHALIDFLLLLQKWNKTYNLTAINDLSDMLVLHIFDSLAVTPYITGPNILDIGTGAGLPGIPLALVFPDYNFVLLDSNHKKITFINHVILSLGIKNVTAICERIEKFHWQTQFNTIMSRATTSVSFIVANAKQLCCNKGQILMMKGKYPQSELEALDTKALTHKIDVPNLNADRHLICVTM